MSDEEKQSPKPQAETGKGGFDEFGYTPPPPPPSQIVVPQSVSDKPGGSPGSFPVDPGEKKGYTPPPPPPLPKGPVPKQSPQPPQPASPPAPAAPPKKDE